MECSTKALLRATLTPSSCRVAAVGAARSHNLRSAQVSVCEADFSTSLGARDDGGPSVLCRTRLLVAEAAVVVGPLDSALGGSDCGKDANDSDDCRGDGVGMHVDEVSNAGKCLKCSLIE